jgi:hypothetical protein
LQRYFLCCKYDRKIKERLWPPLRSGKSRQLSCENLPLPLHHLSYALLFFQMGTRS